MFTYANINSCIENHALWCGQTAVLPQPIFTMDLHKDKDNPKHFIYKWLSNSSVKLWVQLSQLYFTVFAHICLGGILPLMYCISVCYTTGKWAPQERKCPEEYIAVCCSNWLAGCLHQPCSSFLSFLVSSAHLLTQPFTPWLLIHCCCQLPSQLIAILSPLALGEWSGNVTTNSLGGRIRKHSAAFSHPSACCSELSIHHHLLQCGHVQLIDATISNTY